MSNIISIGGNTPQIKDSAWVAQNATVTGKVSIGENSSIWFQTVIRGDVNHIIIGDNTNIQDLSMIHGTHGKQDTLIGNHVTIGHRAIIHGCTIHDMVLIGMGAIILDDTIIPSDVIVAAGAVVTQGQLLESGYLYAGVPAKKIRKLSDDNIAMLRGSAAAYVKYAQQYKD